MNDSGVYQLIVRRAIQAGLDVHPHQLRHTFAAACLRAGGQEVDLMRLAGWRRAIVSELRAGPGELRLGVPWTTRGPGH